MSSLNSISDLSNPLSVFPHRLEGSQVPPVKDIFCGGDDFSFFEILPGIAGADGHKLQHARIAVTIDHTASAAVTNQLRRIEFVDVAHRRLPEMAAIQVEVPIEVEILVTAQAPEILRLLAQVPLHLRQRLGGIDHRIAAMPFHGLDLLEHLNEFLGFVTDEARITEAKIARSQIGQRIAEGAALETKFTQEYGQFVGIVDQ